MTSNLYEPRGGTSARPIRSSHLVDLNEKDTYSPCDAHPDRTERHLLVVYMGGRYLRTRSLALKLPLC